MSACIVEPGCSPERPVQRSRSYNGLTLNVARNMSGCGFDVWLSAGGNTDLRRLLARDEIDRLARSSDGIRPEQHPDGFVFPAMRDLADEIERREAEIVRIQREARTSAERERAEDDAESGWYSVVSFGGHYGGPHGPWKTRGAAKRAVYAYAGRVGSQWGTIVAAGSVRIVGPFKTRAQACKADISDGPVAWVF